MKPIYQAWCCQIEVNNVCPHRCTYCTRYVSHVRVDQRFNMDLGTFRKAILSLNGWHGKVGLIGGEPVIHPQFEELCLVLRDESQIPRLKLGLWTSGGPRFEKYKTLINEVFGFLACNEHSELQKQVCLHQPLTIAVGDMVEDEEYRKQLIDQCWLQRTWCPSIAPKGCFFCEVACALDIILDGPGGWPIAPTWWKKESKDFQDQVGRYCIYCGMPVPLQRELLSSPKEKFSPGLLRTFREHNLKNLSDEDIILFERKLTIKEMEERKRTWDPGNYRQDLRLDMEHGWRERYKDWYEK